METNNRAYGIVFILAAIVVVGGAVYLHFRVPVRVSLPNPVTRTGRTGVGSEARATSSGTTVQGVEFDEIPKVSPKKSMPAKNRVAPPSLDRPLVFSANLSSSQRTLIAKKIAEISAILRENSDAFNSWVDLGIERKTTGDYEGARDAWEYASAIRPHNSLSFGNLGDLYGYYLRDPQKAEQRFLTAVKNDPTLTYLFIQTADFYIWVLGDRPKAIAFLKQSVKDNPGSQELKKVLESYSKS